MNLVRHELGLSAQESRFPTKATCLAIYSRAVNAEQELEAVLARSFPRCCAWEDELRALFAAYLDAKQRQHVLDAATVRNRIPRAVPAACCGGDPGAQLPLERADSRRVQRGDLARGGTLHQEPVVGTPVGRPSPPRYRRPNGEPSGMSAGA